MENIFAIRPDVDQRTYIDRSALDGIVTEALEQEHHVIVYGPSKSGKTWLRKSVLSSRETLIVQCRANFEIEDIYRAIRDTLQGSTIASISSSRREGTTVEASAEASASTSGILAQLVSIGTKFGIRLGSDESTEEVVQRVFREPDVRDPAFIAELVKASGRQVIVEDFHYLKPGVQSELSTDLKALWEQSCPWVLVSTYAHASGLLVALNSDLGGRSVHVHLAWEEDDLRALLEKAESFSEWVIDEEVAERGIRYAFGNVGIFVSLMGRALSSAMDRGSAEVRVQKGDLDAAVEGLVREYLNYLDPLCEQFIKGRRERSETEKTTPTKAYGAILAFMLSLSAREAKSGVRSKRIEEFHKNGAPQYTRILKEIADYQLVHMPKLMGSAAGRMLIAYDHATRSVSVVDPELLFLMDHSEIAEGVRESAEL